MPGQEGAPKASLCQGIRAKEKPLSPKGDRGLWSARGLLFFYDHDVGKGVVALDGRGHVPPVALMPPGQPQRLRVGPLGAVREKLPPAVLTHPYARPIFFRSMARARLAMFVVAVAGGFDRGREMKFYLLIIGFQSEQSQKFMKGGMSHVVEKSERLA